MAKILVLGGGFGGLVAAKRLAENLGNEHQITLVSRSRKFVFYPALVKLAFGKCTIEDVSFDLRSTLLNLRVNFIEAEVARIDPDQRKVNIANGEVEGNLFYDYLIFALGRRLATERITGFYENSHHLLNIDKALAFGQAIGKFRLGDAVIGQCPDARLPIPVYETAFALSRRLQERGHRETVRITIVSPDPPGYQFNDPAAAAELKDSLATHDIRHVADFPINRITPGAVMTRDGRALNFNLLMLVPPFQGSPAASYLGISNNGYINVDATMRVRGVEGMYAAGDCVNFSGPKLGYMAVRQAEVAAANLAAEIEGRNTREHYSHEMKVVIDEGNSDSIYLHRNIWTSESKSVRPWSPKTSSKTCHSFS